MPLPKIAIIISSTREGRFGDKPARWLLALAARRADAEFEILDLRDYPLPFYDEPAPPARAPARNEVAQRLSAKLTTIDGFVFVTAEYNHGIPAVLKNALDHVYPEFNRKPAAFVGYGNAGGARAIEQLRLNLIELKAAPLQSAVGLGVTELRPLRAGEKDFADFPNLAVAAEALLDDLLWWTNTLRAGRSAA
jgi:NAD(P)H-dependent FMN reductase